LPWFGKGKSSVEVQAYQLFEQGKSLIDVAQDLSISPDKATEYHSAWNKMKTDQQTKAFAGFANGKDLLTIATDLGVRLEVVESLYRTYLNSKKRQDDIKREIDTDRDKAKSFVPPFYVMKMIRNPYTGRGLTVEKAPMSFDEPPKSWMEFDGFVRNNGDGEYIIQDSEGKRVSRINVQGMGFNDPSEIEDGEGYWGDAHHRGGPSQRERGMRGRQRPGMPMQGMVPLAGGGDPYMEGVTPEDADAMKFMRQEDRRREVYYRVAELATNRGDADTAIKYLQMAEHNGKVPKDGEGPKSFIDELINVSSNDKKLELLKKIFGSGGGEKEDKDDMDPELKKMKMMGDMAEKLIPQIKENIIDPAMEAFSGEKTSVDALERSALGGTGKLRRGGQLGPSWQQQQAINPRQNDGRVALGAGNVKRIKPLRNPQQILPAEIQERIEVDRAYQTQQGQTESDDDEDDEEDDDDELDDEEDEDFELKKADDYGQPILADELDTVKATKTEIVGDAPKLGIDEKYAINKLLPRFKNMIIEHTDAVNNKDETKEALMLPERIAREDYHTMTKSSYAMFFGKKRLLKAYKAASEGVTGLLGKNMIYIRKKQDEALVNGMDVAAEKLRELGVAEFKKIWDPPEGMNFKVAVKELLRYIILKDCLITFNSPEGNAWLDRYCKEFVKAVDEDFKTDDKRAKIRTMLQKGDSSKTVGPEAKPVAPQKIVTPKPVEQPKPVVKQNPVVQRPKVQPQPMVKQNVVIPIVKKSVESENNVAIVGKAETKADTTGTTETSGRTAITASGNGANGSS
jgi:hypothetical protein